MSTVKDAYPIQDTSLDCLSSARLADFQMGTGS